MYQIGAKVKVNIPEDSYFSSALLKKYDQTEQEVSKCVSFGCAASSYCELKGVESEKGVPFSFPSSWLDNA